MTLKLLDHWQRGRTGDGAGQSGSGGRLLVVAAFRSEEAAAAGLLRALQPSAHVTLSPSRADDVRRLAESMAGRACPRRRSRWSSGSRGGARSWPRRCSGGWSSRGRWSPTRRAGGSSRWRWRTCGRRGTPPRSSAAGSTCCRRERTAVPLGRRGAGPRVRARAGGESWRTRRRSRRSRHCDEARRRQIVWAETEQTRCAFVHDKLREALLARLTPRSGGSCTGWRPRGSRRWTGTASSSWPITSTPPARATAPCPTPWPPPSGPGAARAGDRRAAVPDRRARRQRGRRGDPLPGGRGPGRRADAPRPLRRGRRPVRDRAGAGPGRPRSGRRSRASSASWPSSAATCDTPARPSSGRCGAWASSSPGGSATFFACALWEVLVQVAAHVAAAPLPGPPVARRCGSRAACRSGSTTAWRSSTGSREAGSRASGSTCAG